ncbi:MAG TPA: hypothetical protein VII06_40085 [Chloroflexota bacterium]|jgi:hypothetical protein
MTRLTIVAALLCAVLWPARAPAAAQGGDCALAPFRQRLDAMHASIADWSETDHGTIPDRQGRPFQRIDIRYSGVLDGCVSKEGPYAGRLYDVPDISLPQEELSTQEDYNQPFPLPLQPGHGNTGARWYATARFRAEDGAGMTVLYPTGGTPWNGKLFLVQHGSGVYPPFPELVPRSPAEARTDGFGGSNFAELMVDKGYAVAWLTRDGNRLGGISEAVVQADGTTYRTTFQDYAAHILLQAEVAQDYIARTLGQRPAKTYYYGKSAGGISGRLANYAPGANVAAGGGPIIDGFLIDDAGGGRPLPVLFQGGVDVLFQDAAARAAFVPQIDVGHQLYYPASYLAAKRENARLLTTKGLGEKHRYYEVRSVSHFDAGQAGTVGRPDNLDLGGVMSGFIDLLDAWVDRGIAPPPSMSDVPGSVPAIALPEAACPLGVYYPNPASAPNDRTAAQTTGLALFDGTDDEPLDYFGKLVDMNGNGQRDQREGLTAAWRRLGLLAPGQEFGVEPYADCVAAAAGSLADLGLISPELLEWYKTEAPQGGLGPLRIPGGESMALEQ